MHGAAFAGLRIERVAEIEVPDDIAEARAQLDRHVVVAVPYRRRLQCGSSGPFGRALREDRSRSCEGNSGSGEQEMAHERKTP